MRLSTEDFKAILSAFVTKRIELAKEHTTEKVKRFERLLLMDHVLPYQDDVEKLPTHMRPHTALHLEVNGVDYEVAATLDGTDLYCGHEPCLEIPLGVRQAFQQCRFAFASLGELHQRLMNEMTEGIKNPGSLKSLEADFPVLSPFVPDAVREKHTRKVATEDKKKEGVLDKDKLKNMLGAL